MPRVRPKNSPLARFLGLRRDGSERWEGHFSITRNNERTWFQKAGFSTKTAAESWAKVEQAKYLNNEKLPDRRVKGTTFAEAADEWLRWAEHQRNGKPSTLREYRSAVEHHLKPAFAGPLTSITTQKVEAWYHADSGLSARTRNKLLTNLHGILQRAVKAFGLPANPAAGIERDPQPNTGDYEVFSREELDKLLGHAGSDLDRAIFLTAACTGLRRGELIALRWRDVDFDKATIRVRASYAAKTLTPPKSNKVRSVPMVPEVAATLRELRVEDTADDDLVFSLAGGYMDGDALSGRYEKARDSAGLRPLRFHDLRHHFGTRAINIASPAAVRSWMGHADLKTTMKYVHHQDRGDEAARLAAAFAPAARDNVVELRPHAA